MYRQLPRMGRINMILVCSFVTLFLVNSIMGKLGFSLFPYLGFSPYGLLSGKIWTLFTYILIPRSFISTLFEGLIFWFIGTELEVIWGRRKYIEFLSITTLGAALLYFLMGTLFFSGNSLYNFFLTGPSGLASTACVAYGLLFPERIMYFFLFPVKAKWFVVILVSVELYQGIFTPGGTMAWAQIFAMGVGVLWMVGRARYQIALRQGFFSFLPSPSSLLKRTKKNFKKKERRFHIVENPGHDEQDKGNPPRYH